MTWFCLKGNCQSGQQISANNHAQRAETPTASPAGNQRIFRPKLTMQAALKMAESFIDQQHIDISTYWLYRSIYITLGDEKTPVDKKLPGWHFWWVSDTGATGDYVEIFVDMEGRVSRMTSM
jgi:hypothetical protein